MKLIMIAVMVLNFCWVQFFYVHPARATENYQQEKDAWVLDGLKEPDQNRKELLNSSVLENKIDLDESLDEVQTWENRIEFLITKINMGIIERDEADALYYELNDLLTENVLIFKRALRSMPRTSIKPDTFKKKLSVRPPAKPAKETATPSDKKDFQQAFEDLNFLYKNSFTPFYRMRNDLLQEVTPELRALSTGGDIEGVKEFNREIEMISLALQFQSYLIPNALKQFADESIQAPLPLMGRIFKLLITLILFCCPGRMDIEKLYPAEI